MSKRNYQPRKSSLGSHWAGSGTETPLHDDIDFGAAAYRPIRKNTTGTAQIYYDLKKPGVHLPTPKEDWEKMSGPVTVRRLEDIEK